MVRRGSHGLAGNLVVSNTYFTYSETLYLSLCIYILPLATDIAPVL